MALLYDGIRGDRCKTDENRFGLFFDDECRQPNVLDAHVLLTSKEAQTVDQRNN